MKRIFYGNLTIDTTDEVADLVIELGHKAANSQHYRSFRSGNSFGSQAHSVGRSVPVVLVGYLNGSAVSTDVSLLVGRGIPLAIAPIELDLDAPEHLEIVLSGLRKQVEGYGAD